MATVYSINLQKIQKDNKKYPSAPKTRKNAEICIAESLGNGENMGKRRV